MSETVVPTAQPRVRRSMTIARVPGCAIFQSVLLRAASSYTGPDRERERAIAAVYGVLNLKEE